MDHEDFAAIGGAELGDRDGAVRGGDEAGAREEGGGVGRQGGGGLDAGRGDAARRRSGWPAEEEVAGGYAEEGGCEHGLVERADKEGIVVLCKGVGD